MHPINIQQTQRVNEYAYVNGLEYFNEKVGPDLTKKITKRLWVCHTELS